MIAIDYKNSWSVIARTVSYCMVKMNCLTFLAIVALVGLGSAYPAVNKEATLQDVLAAMIQYNQEKAVLEEAL